MKAEITVLEPEVPKAKTPTSLNELGVGDPFLGMVGSIYGVFVRSLDAKHILCLSEPGRVWNADVDYMLRYDANVTVDKLIVTKVI